ncbi:uncharacterized protein LOC126719474 [Quercus robur]|uniref:uncharacterized protein LOC126719474 n=1 Tax=Quercus robur TaxID=38942 RepID=UPI0021622453|nr:uncharacterized protein LOC126719474 [Quercus robur]
MGDPLKPLWKNLWRLNLPAKVKIFAWRACVNGLPTKEKVCTRGITTSNECPICGKELETVHHALLHCDFVNLVWNFWSEFPQMIHRNKWTFHDSALYILAHKPPTDLEMFLTAAWAIWFNRNKVTHDDKCSSPSQTWQMAKNLIEELNDVVNIDLFTPRPSHQAGWSPPPPDVFKVNVDGSSSDLEESSSVGVIIRDCKGQTVAAFCKPLQSHYTADLVEVFAMEQGILLAQELQLSKVLFESDARSVINAINESAFGIPHRHIIQDISHAHQSFVFCSFRHFNRAFNGAAHKLAQFARCNRTVHLWKGVTPSFLDPIVQADMQH